MNEQQYRQILHNRRPASPSPLLAGTVTGDLLREAAANVRRRHHGAEAWERVARPEWLAATHVEAVDGNTLLVAVDNSTVYYDLTRRAEILGAALTRYAPGLARVRFVLRSGDGTVRPDEERK